MKEKIQVFGWSMYDFANTIFSALFITVYFPLFVVLLGGTPFHVGLTISLSMLLAGILVPFLGAVADITQRKKFLLFIFTILCCIFTFFTGFFGLIAALILAFFANFFYRASLDIYDSFLVNVSNPKNIGKISGIGTAAGYLGAIFSILLAYLVGYRYGFESFEGIKAIFILAAILFFSFSLFTFVLVREESKTKIRKVHFKRALRQVLFTFKNIKKFKSLWLFLLASFLYVDAASTGIIFLFLYARDQLNLSLVQFLPLYLIMALAAGLGSLIAGFSADKFGHKKTLNAVLFLWVATVFILYLKTTYSVFVFAGLLGGALLGSIWTTTRPILVDLAPKDKLAELFGYQGLTEKFGGVLGPALFGFVATFVGFRQALLVVIALFLMGALVLSFVKTEV